MRRNVESAVTDLTVMKNALTAIMIYAQDVVVKNVILKAYWLWGVDSNHHVLRQYINSVSRLPFPPPQIIIKQG